MSNQLTAVATLIDDKVKFVGVSGDNSEIFIDYPKPIGEGEGYTSLELFLISFATCTGSTVSQMLRKMHKDVSGLKVTVYGDRRDEHPTYFKKISVQLDLKSKDVDDIYMKKAIKLAEETYCPVWNMVKNNVEIICEYDIVKIV